MTPAWVLVWAVLSPATSSIVPEGDARWLSPQLYAKDPLFLGACRLLCGDGRKFCSWCTTTSSPAPHSPTAGASTPATAGPHVPTESDASAVTAAFTSSSPEPSTTPEITAATTTAPGTTVPPDVAATSEASTAPGETTAAPDTTTTTEFTTTTNAFTTAPPGTTATATTFLGPVVPAR